MVTTIGRRCLGGISFTGLFHPFFDFPLSGRATPYYMGGATRGCGFSVLLIWTMLFVVVIKSFVFQNRQTLDQNALGISSERPVLTRRQFVISDLSVTCLADDHLPGVGSDLIGVVVEIGDNAVHLKHLRACFRL